MSKYLICSHSRSIDFCCPFGNISPCYVGNNGRKCSFYHLSSIILNDDNTYDVFLNCSHPSQTSLFD